MLRGCLLISAMLGAGVLAPLARDLPESNLERLERRIFDAPLGYYYSLTDLRALTGDADALEARWERKFATTEGADKERWALLIAIEVTAWHPERDRNPIKAKQWLAEAGDSFEANSYRATVASMSNDATAAVGHLHAALKQRPSLAMVQHLSQALDHLQKRKKDSVDPMPTWEQMWAESQGQPALRFLLVDKLTHLKEQAGHRAEWIADLEKLYRASPQTAWIEAVTLARIHMKERRAEIAWGWLMKSKAAGIPDARFAFERSTILGLIAGYSTQNIFQAALVALQEAPQSGAAVMQKTFSFAADNATEGKAIAYLRENAKLALTDPISWVNLGLLMKRGNIKKLRETVFSILGQHVAAHPEDLEARFVLGSLLAAASKENEAAAVLKKFIPDAIPVASRGVEGSHFQHQASYSTPFPLSFPGSAETDPRKSKEQSIFEFTPLAKLGKERTAYPGADLYDGLSFLQTMGDLLMEALLALHGVDREGFVASHRLWLEQAKPPLIPQLALAAGIDLSEHSLPEAERLNLTEQLLERALEQGRIGERKALTILRGAKYHILPLTRVEQLGEILMTKQPEQKLALDARRLGALIHGKSFEKAELLLRELEKRIRPGNTPDHKQIRYLSRRLAVASGRKDLAIPTLPPTPAQVAEEEEADFARWVRYFKSRDTDAQPSYMILGSLGAPRDWPFRLLVDQGYLLPGKVSEVMWYWGMSPIDPALSVYESGFASTMMNGEFKDLKRDHYRRLVTEVGEDNLPLAAVRAFYDGSPTPEEQLAAAEDLAEKNPDELRLRAVVAGKALSLGRYKQAHEEASRIQVTHGNLAWFARAVNLICAQELKLAASAEASARALMPLTYQQVHREWLAGHLDALELNEEAAEMRKKLAFGDGK